MIIVDHNTGKRRLQGVPNLPRSTAQAVTILLLALSSRCEEVRVMNDERRIAPRRRILKSFAPPAFFDGVPYLFEVSAELRSSVSAGTLRMRMAAISGQVPLS